MWSPFLSGLREKQLATSVRISFYAALCRERPVGITEAVDVSDTLVETLHIRNS